MPIPRILVADDDPVICSILADSLRSNRWIVETVDNGTDALEVLGDNGFDVAILDVHMPCLNGLDILRIMHNQDVKTKFVFMSGNSTIETAVEAMKLGAREFIVKPFSIDNFTEAVRRIVEESCFSTHVLADRLDAFIKESTWNQSLRLDSLCEKFKISRSYVCRLFQENLHSSFAKRLAYHRIQKAKELLKNTDEPLYIIAEECGFKNQCRFTEVFRKLEGKPPSKYRENVCVYA